MIKRAYLILILLLTLLLPMSILKISAKEDTYPKFNINLLGERPIATLTIKRIKLKEDLYNLDSPNNSIERHVTILKESTFPDQNNSILILAAHSGNGKIAYFEELDNLKINDTIKLVYKDKTYLYYVKDIWEEKKDGYININKENSNQLILTTCSPNKKGYQLIINCIEKESIY